MRLERRESRHGGEEQVCHASAVTNRVSQFGNCKLCLDGRKSYLGGRNPLHAVRTSRVAGCESCVGVVNRVMS